jgi:hypothetical protein
MIKIKEGLIRQLAKAQKKLSDIDRQTDSLKIKNTHSQNSIEEKIQ